MIDGRKTLTNSSQVTAIGRLGWDIKGKLQTNAILISKLSFVSILSKLFAACSSLKFSLSSYGGFQLLYNRYGLTWQAAKYHTVICSLPDSEMGRKNQKKKKKRKKKKKIKLMD